jgi:hypothetical protein
MFDLARRDLDGKILDCSVGPASFNAEATQNGYLYILRSTVPVHRPRVRLPYRLYI